MLEDALTDTLADVERSAIGSSQDVDVMEVLRAQEGFAVSLVADEEESSAHVPSLALTHGSRAVIGSDFRVKC